NLPQDGQVVGMLFGQSLAHGGGRELVGLLHFGHRGPPWLLLSPLAPPGRGVGGEGRSSPGVAPPGQARHEGFATPQGLPSLGLGAPSPPAPRLRSGGEGSTSTPSPPAPLPRSGGEGSKRGPSRRLAGRQRVVHDLHQQFQPRRPRQQR